MTQIVTSIAQELGVNPKQVDAAINLLDGGATVPFIARYRKEVTGSLDDTQLRTLEQRLGYLRELNDRRATILANIDEQGQLTDKLRRAIATASSKTTLEDLYLPFKSKRRTKGQLAIEAGLEPLATKLLTEPQQSPKALAHQYRNQNYPTIDTVLEGAQAILSDRFGNDPSAIATLRQALQQGWLCSKAGRGKAHDDSKFRDYYDHQERYGKTPSHRALAMLRGRNLGELSLSLRIEADAIPRGQLSRAEQLLAGHVGVQQRGRSGDAWLLQTVQHCWKTKLGPSLENELLSQLQQRAETDAIEVFAANMVDLLMAAPAGLRPTLALDPGLRTGCKVAVIDATGKVLATDTIYPHAPQKKWDQALISLAALAKRHQVELIAIGNGTASRETDKLAAELIKAVTQPLTKVMVSEAGASVYSASELAAKEFPQMDVSLRGAVSIGRRLQDPLAELVKIEPKAIGVGQYQHDVNQTQLAKTLDIVVEDCVNRVGVDLNSASAALLSRVAGLTPTLAKNVIEFRDANGQFQSRAQLKKVPRLGPKAFEQCAGFLRISHGDNPLDGSGVHPEAYSVVEQMGKSVGLKTATLIGNTSVLQQLQPQQFINAQFGLPTVTDILTELAKPGRDPRGEFTTASFADGVEKISDLEAGMILEGVVTNVTHFGAFIDIGVKQDGLVHISALANKFVDDPRSIVKAGDVVRVKVMEIDQARKRIGLSMKLQDEVTSAANNRAGMAKTQTSNANQAQPKPAPSKSVPTNGIFADAFAKAKRR
ncbi:Tex family protein [Ferrimonas lipolytica]|uniref:RNA-binding transcriptional accessory protein n=1 Tax=Ferrimonas lipolytica TaxID=2724191 RepID=A0A6H1UJB8_9GAMM|nr:Tex family protein [Ferrimonas lipolytica]QIZ78403.1 RNA-binding transcriptional accessory protein [Ferrimonas lipolytica]